MEVRVMGMVGLEDKPVASFLRGMILEAEDAEHAVRERYMWMRSRFNECARMGWNARAEVYAKEMSELREMGRSIIKIRLALELVLEKLRRLDDPASLAEASEMLRRMRLEAEAILPSPHWFRKVEAEVERIADEACRSAGVDRLTGAKKAAETLSKIEVLAEDEASTKYPNAK